MHKLSRYILIQIVKIFCILSLASFIPNVYASGGYDARFNTKYENGLLYLNIKLAQGFKIYGNEVGDAGMQTHITLHNSHNLQSFQIIWPIPVKEYFHGTMFHYIYYGNVTIPVELSAKDPSHPVNIKGVITYAICNETCVPVTQEIEMHIPHLDGQQNNFVWVLVAALIGGMILNLMPCVLPVLMLKIFGILSNREKGYRKHLIATITGIFSTFLILAFLTAGLKTLGITFGMGANFQAPQFVIILCIMMVIFTSNILGRFEMNLPGSISTGLSHASFRNNYFSSFLSGVIATIFATPCTAPFLGTAISFAMTAEISQIMQIFMCIATGFSVPYILLIMAPRLLSLLPKPGPWMLHFKKILALAMIITILWLLSILHAQLGMRSMFGVVMLLLLMKFIFEQNNIPRLLRIILAAILFLGSMYLPTMASEEDQAKINAEIKLWHPFDEGHLRGAVEAGKIVVLDFTADWCMTCKYNQFMLWNRTKTIKLLNNPNIIAMRGDLTNRSLIIQKYLQSKGVHGIPFDIVYSSNVRHGIVLPTIAGYEDLRKALEKAGLFP